jgi:DNA-binding transcriptional regulator YdaS (Cro superfamily)
MVMNAETPPEKVALRKAAALLGGQAAMARLIGYPDRRNVTPWFTTDRPFPAEHCPDVELATRAIARERNDETLVVRCEDLRPDVRWGVLRARPEEAAHAG